MPPVRQFPSASSLAQITRLGSPLPLRARDKCEPVLPRPGGGALLARTGSQRARGAVSWCCKGVVCPSIQAPLLNDHILPHNQAVGGHLAKPGQSAVDMLVGVDERNHDGQLASGFDEMGGMDFASPEKTGYGVEGDGSEDIFFAQIFQNLQMQR